MKLREVISFNAKIGGGENIVEEVAKKKIIQVCRKGIFMIFLKI